MVAEKLFDNYLTRVFNDTMGELDRWVEGFDPLRFSRRYREVMQRRHGTIKILGMAKPVPISSIYIDLWAHRAIASRQYMDSEELEEMLREYEYLAEYGARLGRIGSREFLEQTRHALILGKPGSGKTTLLKHLVVSLLSNRPPFQAFPVYVSLREFADSNFDSIIEYVTEDCDKNMAFPKRTADPFIKRMLTKGEAALLLDGLDEVEVEDRADIVSAVEALTAEYPAARFIISCRTADYQGWFSSVEEVEIADFTRTQVIDFIKRWFKEAPNRGNALLGVYDEHPNIRELCSTPLLSALICILYQYNIQLPHNRAELYSECIDALLYKWDASRLITRHSAFAELSTIRKKSIIAELAHRLMTEGLVVIPKKHLVSELDSILTSYGSGSGEDVLKEISSHHALLLERSAGLWSFMHLTFQEYFTALAVVQNRTETELIRNHLEDPRWREVIIMVASLLPDARRYVSDISDGIMRSVKWSIVKPFLGHVLYIATTSSGLKETKDIIDQDFGNAVVFSAQGEKKIQQIKFAREVGNYFQMNPLLSQEVKDDFYREFSGDNQTLTIDAARQMASTFGKDGLDQFWLEHMSSITAQIQTFRYVCQVSFLSKEIVHSVADRLLLRIGQLTREHA